MSTRARASLLVLVLLVASASLEAAVVAGRDYRVLSPAQYTDSPGKIEVLQFFSYGCPHCATIHEAVSKWAGKLPKDVAFKYVPVGFGRPAWVSLAKTYYALESMGELKKVDGALYRAVHEQRLPLVDEARISAWMGKQGVDARKFSAAFNSFSVGTKVTQAASKAEEYKIDAVPAFAVDGRFVALGHTPEEMLKITEELIARVRSETRVGRQPAAGR